MFTKNNKNQPEDDIELEFTTMPGTPGSHEPASANLGAKKERLFGKISANAEKIFHRDRSSRTIFIISAVLLLSAVGVLSFFTYNKFFSAPNDIDTFANIQIPGGSGSEEYSEMDLDSDEDGDGLSLRRELALGTDPNNSDTDGDGISDGDEVNVYGTDPLLYDTSNDGLSDGYAISRGLSPVLNPGEPSSDEEVALWDERIAEFGLHEPTITTLLLAQNQDAMEDARTYTNLLHGFEAQIPAILDFREFNNGQKVGIYVSGTTPTEDSVDEDPMTFSLAIKAGGQGISDWIDGLYRQGEDFTSSETVEINGLSAVRLRGVANPGCLGENFYFPKNGVVIVFSLNCALSEDFVALYEQIAYTFNFTD